MSSNQNEDQSLLQSDTTKQNGLQTLLDDAIKDNVIDLNGGSNEMGDVEMKSENLVGTVPTGQAQVTNMISTNRGVQTFGDVQLDSVKKVTNNKSGTGPTTQLTNVIANTDASVKYGNIKLSKNLTPT